MDEINQVGTAGELLHFAKNSRKRYLIKEEALRDVLENALKLKKDKENVSTFIDRYNNQMFFVLTEEQFYLIISNVKNQSNQLYPQNNTQDKKEEIANG